MQLKHIRADGHGIRQVRLGVRQAEDQALAWYHHRHRSVEV